MKVFTETKALKDYLQGHSNIGFVPTMGALHAGHLSLIAYSKQQCALTVCSIFVNPAQFNDKKDLENYPRPIERDLELLEKSNCDVVFTPSASEMYPTNAPLQTYNFGILESIMEGEHRPGHFNGMANVVQRLFSIVQPHYAFFGEKDFQQLSVVKQLVDQLKLPIHIVPCKIVRETDGLAMSSRNALLTPAERIEAAGIFKVLSELKHLFGQLSLSELKKKGLEAFKQYPLIQPEYLEFANAYTLAPLFEGQTAEKVRIFVAIRIGKVRLIDNLELDE